MYVCDGKNWSCDNTTTSAPISNTLSVNFSSQLPSDLTNTNLFGQEFINITYNVTNTTTMKNMSLYYKVNGSDTCFVYINGSCSLNNYQYANYTITVFPNYTFALDDNDVLPGTYPLSFDVFEETPHSVYSMNTATTYALATLYNITSGKQYGIYENMVLNQSGTGALRHYYCNNSFDFTDPGSSTDCTLFYSLAGTSSYNHSHSEYSKHQVIPFSVNSSGYVNSVLVSSKSYFLVRGIASTVWNASYIPNISSVGQSRVTVNNGVAWTNLSGTFDIHLHQFNLSDALCYYSTGYLTDGTLGNSSVRCDTFNITRLPPNSPVITNPADGSTVVSNVSINYTACTTPYGNITSYTINITRGSDVLLSRNNSLNLSYVWLVSHLDNGDLDVRVDCFSNYSMSSFSVNSFTLDYPYPFPYNNTVDSSWTIDFEIDTTPGVLLLFFYLALICFTLLTGILLRIPFMVWLAACMLFFLGFIIAFKASILFGILVCFTACILFVVGALMI